MMGGILGPITMGINSGLFGLSNLFSAIPKFGLESSIMIENDFSKETYSSLILFSLFLSSIIYFALLFFGIEICTSFGLEDYVYYLPWILLTIPLNSLSLILSTFYYKDMNFKPSLYIEMSNLGFKLLLGIPMALMDYGINALIVPTILSAVLSLSLWLLIFKRNTGWILPSQFSFTVIRTHYKLGGSITLKNFISKQQRSIDKFIILSVHDSEILGFYDLAYKLYQLPFGVFNKVIQKICMPLYVDAKTIEDTKKIYFKSMRLNLVFNVITYLIAYNTLEYFLTIYFQGTWFKALEICKAYCIYGLLTSFLKVGHGTLFFSLKKPATDLWRTTFEVGIFLTTFYIFKNREIHETMLYVTSALLIFFLMFQVFIVNKMINAKLWEWLYPNLAHCIGIGIITALMKLIDINTEFILFNLISTSLVIFVVYTLYLFLFFKDFYDEVKNIIIRVIFSKRTIK